MSDSTVTPRWVLTRVMQVDGKNMSLSHEGDPTPKLEITADGRTVLNTSLKVSGRLVVDDLASSSAAPVTVTGGLSVNGGISVTAGLAVKDQLAVAGSASVGGTVEATQGLVGMGAVPVGAILMWSGNPLKLPAGWFLCNGAGWLPNGEPIPDLRGRFVVGHEPGGTDYKAVHSRGGDRERVLTVANLPKDDALTLKELVVSVPYIDGDNNALSRRVGRDVKVGTNGSAAPFDIRPPWYALAYIIYGGHGAQVSSDPKARAMLRNGDALSPGQFVVSPSGRYTFLFEESGRLVLLDSSDKGAPKRLWVAKSNGVDAVGTRAEQQTDGNFVLYTSSGGVAFTANTYRSGTLLRVTDAGKVTVDNAEGRSVWSQP